MLEVALPYKEVVNAIYNSLTSAPGQVTKFNWQIYKYFYHFLKIFYDATVCLSGVYYPTAHHEIHKLYKIANQFEIHREVLMFKSDMEFMDIKFKKY